MVLKVHSPWFLLSKQSVSHGTFGLQSVTSVLSNCIVRTSVNRGFFHISTSFSLPSVLFPSMSAAHPGSDDAVLFLTVSPLRSISSFQSLPVPTLCHCSFLKIQSNRNALAPPSYTALRSQRGIRQASLPRFGNPFPPLLHLMRYCRIHLHQAQPFQWLQNETPLTSAGFPPRTHCSTCLVRRPH